MEICTICSITTHYTASLHQMDHSSLLNSAISRSSITASLLSNLSSSSYASMSSNGLPVSGIT